MRRQFTEHEWGQIRGAVETERHQLEGPVETEQHQLAQFYRFWASLACGAWGVGQHVGGKAGEKHVGGGW